MNDTRHRSHSFCTSMLCTRDVARAAAFYERLLGWQFAPVPGSARALVITRDGSVAHARVVDDGERWVPQVSVPDAADSIRRALALGGALVDQTTVDGLARFATLRDPEGAHFGVWQPAPDEGAQRTDGVGSLWWVEVLSNDVEASTRFYGELFGWRARVTAFEPFDRYVVFERDGEQAGGLLPIGEDWGVSPRWNTIVEVEDADETARLAEASAGCVHFVHTVPSAGRIAVLGDPAGAVFVVRGPVPAAAATGRTAAGETG